MSADLSHLQRSADALLQQRMLQNNRHTQLDEKIADGERDVRRYFFELKGVKADISRKQEEIDDIQRDLAEQVLTLNRTEATTAAQEACQKKLVEQLLSVSTKGRDLADSCSDRTHHIVALVRSVKAYKEYSKIRDEFYSQLKAFAWIYRITKNAEALHQAVHKGAAVTLPFWEQREIELQSKLESGWKSQQEHAAALASLQDEINKLEAVCELTHQQLEASIQLKEKALAAEVEAIKKRENAANRLAVATENENHDKSVASEKSSAAAEAAQDETKRVAKHSAEKSSLEAEIISLRSQVDAAIFKEELIRKQHKSMVEMMTQARADNEAEQNKLDLTQSMLRGMHDGWKEALSLLRPGYIAMITTVNTARHRKKMQLLCASEVSARHACEDEEFMACAAMFADFQQCSKTLLFEVEKLQRVETTAAAACTLFDLGIGFELKHEVICRSGLYQEESVKILRLFADFCIDMQGRKGSHILDEAEAVKEWELSCLHENINATRLTESITQRKAKEVKAREWEQRLKEEENNKKILSVRQTASIEEPLSSPDVPISSLLRSTRSLKPSPNSRLKLDVATTKRQRTSKEGKKRKSLTPQQHPAAALTQRRNAKQSTQSNGLTGNYTVLMSPIGLNDTEVKSTGKNRKEEKDEDACAKTAPNVHQLDLSINGRSTATSTPGSQLLLFSKLKGTKYSQTASLNESSDVIKEMELIPMSPSRYPSDFGILDTHPIPETILSHKKKSNTVSHRKARLCRSRSSTSTASSSENIGVLLVHRQQESAGNTPAIISALKNDERLRTPGNTQRMPGMISTAHSSVAKHRGRILKGPPSPSPTPMRPVNPNCSLFFRSDGQPKPFLQLEGEEDDILSSMSNANTQSRSVSQQKNHNLQLRLSRKTVADPNKINVSKRGLNIFDPVATANRCSQDTSSHSHKFGDVGRRISFGDSSTNKNHTSRARLSSDSGVSSVKTTGTPVSRRGSALLEQSLNLVTGKTKRSYPDHIVKQTPPTPSTITNGGRNTPFDQTGASGNGGALGAVSSAKRHPGDKHSDKGKDDIFSY